MPKLALKGGNPYVLAYGSSHTYIVPVMVNSYLEAVKAAFQIPDEEQKLRTYVKLRELRNDLEDQLIQVDAGLELLGHKVLDFPE